jgi:hypothetical protein
VQYSAVQYGTVQYGKVKCSTEQYSTVYQGPQLAALTCITQHSTAEHNTILSTPPVPHTMLPYRTVPFPTLPYPPLLTSSFSKVTTKSTMGESILIDRGRARIVLRITYYGIQQESVKLGEKYRYEVSIRNRKYVE